MMRAPIRQQTRHIAFGSGIVARAQTRLVQPFLHINDEQGSLVIGRCHARVHFTLDVPALESANLYDSVEAILGAPVPRLDSLRTT